MKRACTIAALALVAVFTMTSVASAQVRVGFGRFGVYVGPGPGYYYGPYNGYYGPYSSNYYSPGWWNNYYSSPAPVQRSYYADPLDRSASVTVLLPTMDAQVWFNDTLMTQQGRERLFTTPALDHQGSYAIRARWTDNGKTIDQTRTIDVRPGQVMTVDFRLAPAENLPPPRP